MGYAAVGPVGYFRAVWAVGLEIGETNGANKDGQSESETWKGVSEMGATGLGLWGCGAVRL